MLTSTIQKKILWVEREIAEEIEELCTKPDIHGNSGRGEVLFDEEIEFENGNRIGIQVIADTEPTKFPAWTQAVMWDKDGKELTYSDVGESFLMTYQLEYEGQTYEVEVKIKET